jgi:hypothetical protein
VRNVTNVEMVICGNQYFSPDDINNAAFQSKVDRYKIS